MRATLIAAGLAGIVLPACGSSRQQASDGPADAGAIPDAGPSEPGSIDGAPIRPRQAGIPLPPSVRPPVQILNERAGLTGNGRSACTHQTPVSANGDRWCVFTQAGATVDLAELWVINVTRAAGGDVPKCDGSSAACLRLSGSVSIRAAIFFEGDTLIYHADPISAPTEDFLGPIYAWRPGWSAGRQISSGRGFTCVGQEHSAAAACFDDPGGDPAKRDSAEVRAGYLLDETGGALPSFGRWPLRNDNNTAWAAGFSPDGAIFLLSSADSIGKNQSLKIVPTAAVGQVSPELPIDDIEYWTISNDGKKIYFIRGLPQRADLWMADFPSGVGAQLIEAGILSFFLIGSRSEDQALGYVQDLGGISGAFKLLRDRSVTMPKTIFTFEDILDGALVSLDLRYTLWLDFAFRGVLIHNDDLASCPIDVGGEPAVFEPGFSKSAGLMFWREISQDHPPGRDAFFASPERCRVKERFATDIDLMVPIGDRGLVFTDEHDESTNTSTLKYVGFSVDGAALDGQGPVRVQERVGSSVTFVGADPLLLMYPATDPTTGNPAVFVFGPVPL